MKNRRGKTMKNRTRILLVLFLLIFSAGCATPSFSPRDEEDWGESSPWGSDQYQNPDWNEMHGY